MHRIITFGSGAHFQAFSPTLFLIQKEVKCHTWIGLTSDSDCFEDKKEKSFSIPATAVYPFSQR